MQDTIIPLIKIFVALWLLIAFSSCLSKILSKQIDTVEQVLSIAEETPNVATVTDTNTNNVSVNISNVPNSDVSVSIKNQTSNYDWSQQTTESKTIVEEIETVRELTFEESAIEWLKKIEHLFMSLFFILIIFASRNEKNNGPHTYWWAPGIALGVVLGINLLNVEWVRQLLFT